ncbi:conserved hypothetical protein [Leptothrix cholodnii SP-6]|uniref:Type VI secretion-associated protein, BMA_A0400 family n=1 Tax=Leptothrix cholodnii (strain ATCC 51168 / LMG 8142 / SP-6) TaxID=395495 RepID=B1XWW1_LEPCP|nr:type VI secretion system-associated protein TagF [Leptothrix cholodnii]ACB36310.1 conserved hypothetical protein [Leptothrix cholodnii SP-6]
MHEAPGWYGKLGALGDFASRRLPHAQVQALDHWLASVMSISQSELGGAWLDHYLRAPLWRYAWAPGVVDNQWWFGVLMPSCDSVGRYFPLLLAQPRAQAPQDRLALNHLELWWRHLAEAALATLAERATLDEFEQALAEAPPWPTPASANPPLARSSRNRITGRPCEEQPLGPRTDLADWLGHRAAQALLQQLGGHSLWWPFELGRSTPPIRLLQGLPDGAEFGALLGHAD